jgi:hypothetical protein
MKPQITTKQMLAVQTILNNLKDFTARGLGTIDNLTLMTNKGLPNNILIKYEKNFVTMGQPDYEFKIAAVAQDGEIIFIQNKLGDIFVKSAFLSECMPFDFEDKNAYDKIN